MAGHSKFKNIQYRKENQDQKRAKLFTRLIREIVSATKNGTVDPDNNARLRNALFIARNNNLPKERIDRALTYSKHSKVDYMEVRFQGFLPGGIAIMAEALSIDKSRTISDIMSCFSKYGVRLVKHSNENYIFKQVGKIVYPFSVASTDKMLEEVIRVGARDLSSSEYYYVILTDIDIFQECLEYLTKTFGTPSESGVEWLASNYVIIEDETIAKKLTSLIKAFDECTAIRKVYTNYKLSQQLCRKFKNNTTT